MGEGGGGRGWKEEGGRGEKDGRRGKGGVSKKSESEY